MKTSHFRFYPIKKTDSHNSKLKKVSSVKDIGNKNEIYKTLTINQFFKSSRRDIRKTRKNPIIKSVLKNSNEKMNQKKDKIRHLINQNINIDEILRVKDRNDIYYQEILFFQDNCEKALEGLFKEKMIKIMKEKQNEIEIFQPSNFTNFESVDEISFGVFPEKERNGLDIEYDKKYEEVFNRYINNFCELDNYNKINSMYMKDIYDNLVGKIYNILYPFNNKKVTFK